MRTRSGSTCPSWETQRYGTPLSQFAFDADITRQDVFASMQGVIVVASNTSDSTASVPSNGGMPAGGPSSDGGAAPTSSTDQSQSAPAGSGLAAPAGVPSSLVESVIQSLQQKITA